MKESGTIHPVEPVKCVWMSAGLVDFKLCSLQFDCEHCSFDRAIRGMNPQTDTPPALRDVRELVDEQGFRLDPASFYDASHIWLRVEEEGRVRVGLDDFGQRLSGRIYSLQLPDPGRAVTAGKECWRITHGYGETALGSGVEGTVVQRNEKLKQIPSLINTDPYGEGWAFLLEPDHLIEDLRLLYYGSRVRQWVAEETHRLRSLLEISVGPDLTLQDGGLPVKDLSSCINSEIIEAFLTFGRAVRNQKRR